MAVAFASVSSFVSNMTEMLPLVQDALVYGANFMVQHPIGLLMIGMVLVGWGVKLAKSIIRGRGGRR